MKYFICPCIFESKLGCSFVKISRLIEDGFIDFKFLIFLKNDCYYICCKDSIYFRFECSRSEDIRATCANIKFPICCYRKYFEEDGILYHFCINCLHEIAMTIPITVINFEIYL